MAIVQEIGDLREQGTALGNLGITYYSLGQYEQAINFHQQDLAIVQEIGDLQGQGTALGNLGSVYDNLGQYEWALDYHQQYLAIAREIGDRVRQGSALGNLGNAYNNLGQVEHLTPLELTVRPAASNWRDPLQSGHDNPHKAKHLNTQKERKWK